MNELNKDFLFAELLNRLKTQNRKKTKSQRYNFFPTIYCKLFSTLECNYENELLTPEIHNLILRYQNNGIKSITFKEIDGMYIDNQNQLFISVSGKMFPLYTSTKKKLSDEFIPFILPEKNFKHATIDHIPSFSKIIIQDISKFPITEKLSKSRVCKSKKYAMNRYHREVIEGNLKDSLWEELKLIHKKVSIELVLDKFNKRE